MIKRLIYSTFSYYFISIVLLFSLTGCKIIAPNANEQFTLIAQNIVNYRENSNPYKNPEGVNGYLLPNLSAENLAQTYTKNLQLLANLDAVDVDKLSDENQINFSIIRAQVQNSVDEYVFNAHFMPLTSEYGFHSSLSSIINRSHYKTAQDFNTYLARLAQVPRFFEQNIHWMKKGLETGLTQPKVVLKGYEDSINSFIVEDVTKSEFYKPFLTNSAELSDSEFVALQQRAQSVIKNKVLQLNVIFLRSN